MTTFVDRVVLHVAAGRRRPRLHLDPPGEVQAARRPRRRQRRPGRRRAARRRPRRHHAAGLPPLAAPPAGNGKPGQGRQAQRRRRCRPAAAGARTGPWSRRWTARCSPTWSGPAPRYVAAQGGRGGLGNAALASARRKAPGFALLGEPGDAADVVLELKTVADVALVGFPSAGKSSLVAALSAARPKIADYPFTTLVPNLGVVEAGEVRYTVADVPGLIPGASQGKGLGLEFLRHVERCSVLVHVVDAATLEPGGTR